MEETRERFKPWQAELRRGLSYLRKGHLVHADDQVSRAYESTPIGPAGRYAMGQEQLRRGFVGDAERLLRSAWDSDRSQLGAATTLARCLAFHRHRFQEAWDVLEEAELEHGTIVPLLVVRSELSLEQGDCDAAKQYASAAVESLEEGSGAAGAEARSALSRACNAVGMSMVGRNELEASLFQFKRAANLDSRWARPLINMGAAFARLGKAGLARSSYEKAAEIEPEDALALTRLGVLLLECGDQDGARDAFLSALDMDPDSPQALSSLGRLYFATNEWEKAVNLLWQVVDITPEDADVWMDLGVAHSHCGRWEDAESSWRTGLSAEPNHPALLGLLADALAREGRYAEAGQLASRVRSDEEMAPAESVFLPPTCL